MSFSYLKEQKSIIIELLHNFVFIVGESYLNLYRALNTTIKGKVVLKDVIFQASTRGVDSIILILITCTFIGMALALHMTNELISTYNGVLYSP